MNKKIHEVKITITEGQKQRLRDLSDITGLSIPDILRWNTFGPGSTLRVPNQKIMGQWLYEINSIGTNLNQSQKLANERNRSGELNHDDFRRLRASIVKTRKSIDEMTAVITKEIKGDH